MVRPEQVTPGDLVLHGTHTCPGCAGSMAVRAVIGNLGTRDVVVETSCVCAGGATLWTKLPTICLMFSNTASVASGLAAGLKALGRSSLVVAFGGDGGTADIGLAAVSGAAERNDSMVYVCLDNEAYMNTGNQKSGTTPLGAVTSTTPGGKPTRKKDVPLIIAHHSVPYVATASVAYPADLAAKVWKAAGMTGFRYLQIHVPCPTGWGFAPDRTVEVARLAVDSGIWPLYEIAGGRLALTRTVHKPELAGDYLRAQRRFGGMTDEAAAGLRDEVSAFYERLLHGEW